MPSSVKSIFVAMPFKAEYEPVLALIKSAATLLDLHVVQLAGEAYVGSVTTKVCNSIDEADILVAVLSEENGNVYYEVGVAHCQRKPVAILTSDPSTLKFDLRDHRALVYDADNPGAARDELVRTLAAALTMATDKTMHLASAFHGASQEADVAADQGLQKALLTVSSHLNLVEPVELLQAHFHRNQREVSIEVRDFLGIRARAAVDVNGIVRAIKRISR